MSRGIEFELNENQILQLKDILLMYEREKDSFRNDCFQDLLIQIYKKGSDDNDY